MDCKEEDHKIRLTGQMNCRITREHHFHPQMYSSVMSDGQKSQPGENSRLGYRQQLEQIIVFAPIRHMVGMYIAASHSCLSQVQQQAMLQEPFPHEPFSSATLIIKSFWVKKVRN